MLNSVSRSLSDVGRTPSHVGAFRRLPLSVPAITRIDDARLKPSRYTPPAPPDLPDLNQLESLLPARQQLVHTRGVRHRRGEPARRLALRGIQHVAVADEIDHPKGRHAGLARPEKIAGPAQPQIALRDFEAVGRVGHRLQALPRFFGERVLIDQ